jgi:hypothetical protein
MMRVPSDFVYDQAMRARPSIRDLPYAAKPARRAAFFQNQLRPLPCGLAIAIVAATCAAVSAAGGPPSAATDWRFRVRYSKEVHASPFTGRVYVFFSRSFGEPRRELGFFHPGAIVAKEVANWKPGEPLEIGSEDRDLLAYPKPLKKLQLSGYQAQAIVRFNRHEPKVGDGAGNGYSAPVAVSSTPIELLVDHLAPEAPFPETERRKEFLMRSELLSRFHRHEVLMRAAVVLPSSYSTSPTRRYPAVFIIPGFSGTHFPRRPNAPEADGEPTGVEFFRVTLDPSCPLGHHAFADSENNGPVGAALVREFLPAFDRSFRSVADPRARFLTGHSSGGWSSLWLQITYPEVFAGVWSTSPDPVDFRDFQKIDLYRPDENAYVDHDGHERPIWRVGATPILTFRQYAQMEWVLGSGGQLHSFEAVFSHRGRDGKPRLLFDRGTGAVDLGVAKSWEPYDIRLVLERNWKTLRPRLAGKVHVFMGGQDTFYLEGATRLLKQSLESLGSDTVVEIHEGRDHNTLVDRRLSQRIRTEMADAFLKAFPIKPTSPAQLSGER